MKANTAPPNPARTDTGPAVSHTSAGIVFESRLVRGALLIVVPAGVRVRLRVNARAASPVRYADRTFGDYPKPSRLRAAARKRFVEVYHRARLRGESCGRALGLAARSSRKFFGTALTERSVRRWLSLVNRAGGYTAAPMEAYLDGRSSPHFNGRRRSEKP